jgi:soluble lytic murein transglycosylase-like protein
MKRTGALALLIFVAGSVWAQSPRKSPTHREAEYYVTAYAQHYQVPLPLVRAIIEVESNWRVCPVSPKGAAGLMQLMPVTAQRLGVRDRCNIDQNVSGGVRYLKWLIERFPNDLRLVTAAYYAGEDIVGRRGLAYRNSDVVAYVAKIRAIYERQAGSKDTVRKTTSNGDMR